MFSTRWHNIYCRSATRQRKIIFENVHGNYFSCTIKFLNQRDVKIVVQEGAFIANSQWAKERTKRHTVLRVHMNHESLHPLPSSAITNHQGRHVEWKWNQHSCWWNNNATDNSKTEDLLQKLHQKWKLVMSQSRPAVAFFFSGTSCGNMNFGLLSNPYHGSQYVLIRTD